MHASWPFRKHGSVPAPSAPCTSEHGKCWRYILPLPPLDIAPPQFSKEILSVSQQERAYGIADRYDGGLSQRGEHQNLWRQKHDALMRRKRFLIPVLPTDPPPEFGGEEGSPTYPTRRASCPIAQRSAVERRGFHRRSYGSFTERSVKRSLVDEDNDVPSLDKVGEMPTRVPTCSTFSSGSSPESSFPRTEIPRLGHREKTWERQLSTPFVTSERNRPCVLRKVRRNTKMLSEDDILVLKASDKTSETSNFDECISLAKKHSLLAVEVGRRKEEFKQLDTNGDNELSLAEFEQAIRIRCNWDADHQLPPHLMDEWLRADKDGNGSVTFEEYLIWCQTHAFTEELLVDPEELLIRNMARKYGFDLVVVERLKTRFDKYDTGKSGNIDEHEFKKFVADLWGIGITDIPERRVKQFWTEVDNDKSGEISFDEFVLWYMKCGLA